MAMEKSISEPNENLIGDLAGTKRSMAVDETLVTTVARRVIDELRRSSQMLSNSVSNLMQISVALKGKSIDLSKVVSMFGETATLLKAERRRMASRVSARRRFRTRRWLFRSPPTRPLTAWTSCPTLQLCRCRKSEFRSASMKKPWTSLFRNDGGSCEAHSTRQGAETHTSDGGNH